MIYNHHNHHLLLLLLLLPPPPPVVLSRDIGPPQSTSSVHDLLPTV